MQWQTEVVEMLGMVKVAPSVESWKPALSLHHLVGYLPPGVSHQDVEFLSQVVFPQLVACHWQLVELALWVIRMDWPEKDLTKCEI